MTDVIDSGVERNYENRNVLASQEYRLGNPNLPIAEQRKVIVDSIHNNSITILVGKTGSGKSTQTPQYALEMDEFDQISVTQPLRIAARTVAERTQQELDMSGERYSVGYYTGIESSEIPQDKQDIAFLTDGKAMMQMLHETPSNKKRLLIIDEVHEWNMNIEQLLAMVRLRTDPSSPQYDPNLKVVLMSATMDSQRLQSYFDYAKPPIIDIEVSNFPVESSETKESVAVTSLKYAAQDSTKVLAFHAGKGEISKTINYINFKNPELVAIALHGQQNPKTQSKAFDKQEVGTVVATTNAGETSITVPDVDVVVDGGKVRVSRVRYDLIPTGSKGLYLEDAPQKSLIQRKGRTGRVGPGKYILASPNGKELPTPFEDREEYAMPAVQREQLENLVLNILASGNQVSDFTYFHEWPEEAYKAAKERLFNLGAIDKKGAITKRGQFMDTLPLDPEYSAMVAWAYEKDYSDDVKRSIVDIVAIMNEGGILKRSFKEQRWRESLVATHPDGEVKEADSDLIVQLEAYVTLMTSKYIKQYEWPKHDVNEYAVELVDQNRQEIARRLNLELRPTKNVATQDRQSVLTCINAGQINQIWHRSNNRWKLVLGESAGYKLGESSVIGQLGELVTGTLFTTNSGENSQPIHRLLDVNRIVTADVLEQVANHLLVRSTNMASAKYDPEKGMLMAPVEVRLGRLMVSSTWRPIEAQRGGAEGDLLSAGYREHTWKRWFDEHRTKPLHRTDPADVQRAMDNMEISQYGVDPVNQEPLFAYRGRNGQWYTSETVALNTLKAELRNLDRLPKKTDDRIEKELVRQKIAELNASRKSAKLGRITDKEYTELRRDKKKIPRADWLIKADVLLRRASRP